MDRIRLFLKARLRVPWGVHLILGMVTAWVILTESRHWFSKRHPLEANRYLVANRALQAGLPFSGEDFGYTFGENEQSQGAYTDQDLALLSGAVLKRSLEKGALLSPNDVDTSVKPLAVKVPRGYLAYPLRPGNRLPVGNGDHVDIIWSPKQGGENSVCLLEGARVLETTGRAEKWEVVLALTHPEIQILEKGRQQGKLTLALQSREAGGHRKPLRSKNHLILRQKSRIKRVEIISEGE